AEPWAERPTSRVAAPTSASAAVRDHLDRLRLLDESDELCAVSAPVLAERGLREVDRLCECGAAAMLGVAEHHAEGGDGGGERQVGGGCEPVGDRVVEARARVARRLLVADLHIGELVSARSRGTG